MGDPKKPRKKYKTPFHPWEKERLDIERVMMREFGLTNKKEIWKAQTILQNFKAQAKKCATARTEQLQREKMQLLQKLQKLNLIGAEGSLDDVLGMNTEDILKRRLQTFVYEKKLANTIKQARQFIIHGHVTVNGKKVTVPSYLMTKEEEAQLGVILENG